MIAAAAVLILVAVGVSLSGRIEHTPKSTPPAAANGGHNSASPQVQGNGAPEATTRQTATPTHSAPPPQTALCHPFYAFLRHPDIPGPGWKARLTTESADLQQLIKAAGSLAKVPQYCGPYVTDLFRKAPGPGDSDSHLWRLLDPGLASQGTQGQEPASSVPSPPAVNPALSTSNGSSSGQSR